MTKPRPHRRAILLIASILLLVFGATGATALQTTGGADGNQGQGGEVAPPEFTPEGLLARMTERSRGTSGNDDGSQETRNGGGSDFVPNQLLIRFEPGTSDAERQRVRDEHDLDKIRDLRLPDLELDRIRDRGSPPQEARRVEREASVAYAEPNFVLRHADHSGDPDDGRFHDLWGLDNFGQTVGSHPFTTSGEPEDDIDWLRAWNDHTQSNPAAGVIATVIDEGVQIQHEDLHLNVWINHCEVPQPSDAELPLLVADFQGEGIPDHNGNGRLDGEDIRTEYADGADGHSSTSCTTGFADDATGWDFRNDDNTVFDGGSDDHGTHVSGTVGAVTDNSTGVAGVAQTVIMPLKFLGGGGGSTSDAVDAIDYAIDNGGNVINASWGSDTFSQSLKDAIGRAHDAGVVFVAAAGNDGRDIDDDPTYPPSYDVANIIAVAATNPDDGLASFSNYGDETVHLGAPGTDILSTVPSNDYDWFNGTSMAAPHVTGAVAQLISDYPTLEHLDIKDLVVRSGDHLSSLEGKTITGRRLNLASQLLIQLDTDFGTDGTKTEELSASTDAPDFAIDNALQQTDVDGDSTDEDMFVTVGKRTDSDGAEEMAVVRYDTTGARDTGFEGDGLMSTKAGGDRAVATAVAVDGQDRILVGGYAKIGGELDFVVVRLTADGSLDTTFAGDGIQTTDIGGSDFAYGIGVDSSDRPLVVGITHNGSDFDIGIVRYETDGDLDTTFAGDGIQTTTVGGENDTAYRVVTTSGGKIVVSGATRESGADYDVLLARYDSDGTPDTSFGGDPSTHWTATDIGGGDDGGFGLTIDGSGRFVVSGVARSGDFDAFVQRYDSGGVLDTSFRDNGTFLQDVGGDDDYAVDVIVDGSTETITTLGSTLTSDGARVALVRLPTASRPATVTTAVGGDFSSGLGLAVASDGQMVTASATGPDSSTLDFGAAAYRP